MWREPAVDLKSEGSWQSATGVVQLQKSSLNCPTLAVDVPVMKLTAGDKFVLDGNGSFRTDLERLSRWLAGTGKSSETLHGSLAGPVRFQSRGPKIGLDVDWTGKGVGFGPAKSPLWQEPNLRIQGNAVIDWDKDQLALDQVKIESSLVNGDARGQIARLSSTQQMSLEGKLQYDLARLEPYLRSHLGKDFRIVGKDQRPFRLAGALALDPGSKASVMSQFQGQAGLSWSQLQAVGCKVGPAELRGDLKGGWLRVRPIASSINEGKLLIEPSLRLAPLPVQLEVAKGTIVQRAKITRGDVRRRAGLRRTRAGTGDERRRFDLGGRRRMSAAACGSRQGQRERPASNPRRTDRQRAHHRRARLTLAPGPVRGSTRQGIDRQHPIADGKVYHDKLELVFPDLTVRTHGWVGMDEARLL